MVCEEHKKNIFVRSIVYFIIVLKGKMVLLADYHEQIYEVLETVQNMWFPWVTCAFDQKL